jgi:hypothetical protein
MRTFSRALGLVVAVALLPGSALADISLSPTMKRTLRATGSTDRTCGKGTLSGPGIATAGYAAPMTGGVAVQMSRGSGDWDLAVIGAGGKRLGGSQAFGSAEVVSAAVKAGDRVAVVGCRRPGSKATVPLRVTFAETPADGPAKARAGKASLVEVQVPDRAAMERLQALPVDVTHDVHAGRANVQVYGADELALLRREGFSFKVLVEDVAANARRERAQDRAYAARMGAKGSPLPSSRTSYRTLEDVQGDIKKLVADNPSMVREVKLNGETFQGREIQVIEIAKDVNAANDGRPYYVLIGMHHAREWPAAEMPTEFALDLVNSYGKDPRITKILDTTRVIVMPVTNADGYDHSRNSPLSEGLFVGQYRRKTCSFPFPSGAVPCEAQIGVDPNRNYGESWGGPGASSVPLYDTYRGPSPFSEPEIKFVQKLVSAYPATSLTSIHNIAALVLRPPGLKEDGFAPDEARLKVLGDAMGKATGYTSQYSWQLYDTTGTTEDWSYSATAGFGYTIEIGPSGGDFHGDYKTHMVDEYVGTGKYAGKGMREALLLSAEHARNAQDNSRIAGRSIPGRTLRIVKAFKTKTYSVCGLHTDIAGDGCTAPGAVQELPERLETTMVVPPSGKFEWWVNPSTRPFVGKAGKTEAYKLTCEDAGKVITEMDLTVARGETAKLELPCGGVLPPEEVAPVKKAKPKKKAAKKSKACRKAKTKKQKAKYCKPAKKKKKAKR